MTMEASEKKDVVVKNFMNGSVAKLNNKRVSIIKSEHGGFLMVFKRLQEQDEEDGEPTCIYHKEKGVVTTMIRMSPEILEVINILTEQMMKIGIETYFKPHNHEQQ